MKQVDIYITTTQKCPKPRDGYLGYVLEYWHGQDVITREGFEKAEQVTPHQLELMACIKAMKRLKVPCETEIIGDLAWIQANWENREKWKENNWKNSKGQEIKHKELWQQLDQAAEGHKIAFTYRKSHVYTSWTLEQIRKQEEKENG